MNLLLSVPLEVRGSIPRPWTYAREREDPDCRLIVGSGFDENERQRLAMQFGHDSPVPTVPKAPTSLLCTLPPSQTAGLTRVTPPWSTGTKTHASTDHCEFTYINQLDQKCMSLFVVKDSTDIVLVASYSFMLED